MKRKTTSSSCSLEPKMSVSRPFFGVSDPSFCVSPGCTRLLLRASEFPTFVMIEVPQSSCAVSFHSSPSIRTNRFRMEERKKPRTDESLDKLLCSSGDSKSRENLHAILDVLLRFGSSLLLFRKSRVSIHWSFSRRYN